MDDEIKQRFEATVDLIREIAAASEERHNREMGEIRAELRRAVRLSVEEARRERVRRKEGDEKLDGLISKLNATQMKTEHMLQSLIQTLLKRFSRSTHYTIEERERRVKLAAFCPTAHSPQRCSKPDSP